MTGLLVTLALALAYLLGHWAITTRLRYARAARRLTLLDQCVGRTHRAGQHPPARVYVQAEHDPERRALSRFRAKRAGDP